MPVLTRGISSASQRAVGKESKGNMAKRKRVMHTVLSSTAVWKFTPVKPAPLTDQSYMLCL